MISQSIKKGNVSLGKGNLNKNQVAYKHTNIKGAIPLVSLKYYTNAVIGSTPTKKFEYI